MVRNIQRVQKMGDFDTVIIGRGGGSIEDLWPFNEERVARAIAACELPVISSVGHETDTTIADLVADVRAATPTAAAELAVPVLTEEILRIEEKQARLQQAYIRQIQRKQERFQRVQNSYIFRQPERLYEAQSVKLDQLNQRMNQTLQRLVYEKEKVYTQLDYRLQQSAPVTKVKEAKQEVEYLKERLQNQAWQIMNKKQQTFEQTIQALDLLSPLKIMGRGYSYTTKNEKVVKSVHELMENDRLNIHYKDGQVQTKVVEIKEDEDGRGNI